MPVLTTSYYSPVGELILGSFQNKLCMCDWKHRRMRSTIDKRISSSLNQNFQDGMDPTLEQSIEELNQYFASERIRFDIPILECGTSFQKYVWKALRSIPYGTVKSYGELALTMGRPTAVRAVANANGGNAISIITPCHRIVGSDGNLVGYAGGTNAKRQLLQLECQDQMSFSFR